MDKRTFMDIIGFHGGASQFGECHWDLVNWQESWEGEHRRDLIIMPRGHLKTTIATVLDILHSLYVNPNLRIFIGSANSSLSKAIMREIMSNFADQWLQDNVWNNRPHFDGRMIPILDSYGRIQRNRQQQESARDSGGDFDPSELDTNEDKKVIWRQDIGIQLVRTDKLKEPSVVVGSSESPSTGFHYDKLYFDDIINFDNYDKPEKVERLDIWRDDMFNVLDDCFYDEDLEKRLFDCTRSASYRKIMKQYCYVGGDVTAVGTRYFKHDWYAKLIDKPENGFRVYWQNIYKNGIDADGGYLWHERWNERIEKNRRASTSKKNFHAQYLNRIVVEDEQVIPFRNCLAMNPVGFKKQEGLLRVRYINAPGDKPYDIVPYLVIDPAATHNENSDYTCIVVGGKDRDENLYLLDIWCGREASTRWIKRVFDYCRKWDIRRVHLETVAFATELKTTFRLLQTKDLPIFVVDYKPKAKGTKKERIQNGLQPLFDCRKVFVQPYVYGMERVTEQFDFFPSDTVHDDAPDALQMLNEIAKPTRTGDLSDPNHRPTPLPINTRFGGLT